MAWLVHIPFRKIKILPKCRSATIDLGKIFKILPKCGVKSIDLGKIFIIFATSNQYETRYENRNVDRSQNRNH